MFLTIKQRYIKQCLNLIKELLAVRTVAYSVKIVFYFLDFFLELWCNCPLTNFIFYINFTLQGILISKKFFNTLLVAFVIIFLLFSYSACCSFSFCFKNYFRSFFSSVCWSCSSLFFLIKLIINSLTAYKSWNSGGFDPRCNVFFLPLRRIQLR